MTPPPIDISPDQAFEDQVRGMLARRAGDITEADLAAELDRPASLRRPAPARRPWVLVAAAAVIVALALAATLARPGGDTTEDVAADDGSSTTATDPADAVVIPGLPAGLTPDDLVPLGPPAGTLDGGAQAYLETRVGALGPVTIVEGAQPIIDGGDDWAVRDWWLGSGEAVSAGAAPGTVYLHRTEEGWSVVAALSSVFDLRAVTVGDDSIRGSVRSAYPEQWTVGLTRADRLQAADDWDAVLATLGARPNGTATRSQAIAVGPIQGDAPVALLVVGRVIADEVAFAEVAFAPGSR